MKQPSSCAEPVEHAKRTRRGAIVQGEEEEDEEGVSFAFHKRRGCENRETACPADRIGQSSTLQCPSSSRGIILRATAHNIDGCIRRPRSRGAWGRCQSLPPLASWITVEPSLVRDGVGPYREPVHTYSVDEHHESLTVYSWREKQALILGSGGPRVQTRGWLQQS